MDPNKPRSLSPTSFQAVVAAVEKQAATSMPPQPKATMPRMTAIGLLAASFSDWGAMYFLYRLLVEGIVQEQYRIWVIATIALIGSPSAVGSLLSRFGKGPPTGSATALLVAAAGKIGLAGVAKGAGMMGLVLLMGCATLAPLAVDAMKAILPAARDALVQEAERRGAEMDTNEAICFAAPDEYQPDDYLLVTCIAPEREE
jgi:hypothetical protein